MKREGNRLSLKKKMDNSMDDIPSGQFEMNLNESDFNFEFEDLLKGNEDSRKIASCANQIDELLRRRHHVYTLIRDIRRFSEDKLPEYVRIPNLSFTPKLASKETRSYFDNIINDFMKETKQRFRNMITEKAVEYTDNLSEQTKKMWQDTSKTINVKYSSILNSEMENIKEKWAKEYRNSTTNNYSDNQDTEKPKPEREVSKSGKDESELKKLKKEMEELKQQIKGNGYNKRGGGRGGSRGRYYSRI